jgi:hypothetical protein
MRFPGKRSFPAALRGLVAMLFLQTCCYVSALVHMPISHRWRGGVAPRHASVAAGMLRPAAGRFLVPLACRRGVCPPGIAGTEDSWYRGWRRGRQLEPEAAARGVHQALRRRVCMAAIYHAEVTFPALDVQKEFFVAKTLGSIALPGSVFHCTTEPSSEGNGELSHFKFDFEHNGSVDDARGFLAQKFPDADVTDGAQSESAVVVSLALLTYCAEMTFKALSDHQEVAIASNLRSFALPNCTFVSFDDAVEAAEDRTVTFQFQFELGGTLEDAGELVDKKFPTAVNRLHKCFCLPRFS